MKNPCVWKRWGGEAKMVSQQYMLWESVWRPLTQTTTSQ